MATKLPSCISFRELNLITHQKVISVKFLADHKSNMVDKNTIVVIFIVHCYNNVICIVEFQVNRKYNMAATLCLRYILFRA